MFESLTKFIPQLENLTFEKSDNPFYSGPMPLVVDEFVDAVYEFTETNSDFDMRDYITILKENEDKINPNDFSNLDGKIVVALIFSQIRGERFGAGVLESAIKSGKMKAWLLRLKEIDS